MYKFNKTQLIALSSLFIVTILISLTFLTNNRVDASPNAPYWEPDTGPYDNIYFNDGFVGIGTNTPGTKLEVKGSTEPFRVSNGTYYFYTGINRNANGTVDIGGYNTSTAQHTNVVIAPSGGNVGVGMVPTNKFTVNGTLEASDFSTAGNKNILIGNDAYFTDVDQANTLGIYGNANSDQITLQLGSNGKKIKVYSNGDMCLGSC